MMQLATIFFAISSVCPNVKLQTNPPLNLTEYTRSTWYVQQQQPNGYQKPSDLFCVAATYDINNKTSVPFYNGQVISVYNYANYNKTNGINMNNSTILCARQTNKSEPEKLLVAPCFLPNILAGSYWVLAAGPYSDNYDWAVVIGGQPTLRVSNTTCTTKLSGINNSGLWIFSRKPIICPSLLKSIRTLLQSRGISTDYLLDVVQEGCRYNGAFIKN